MNFLTKEKLNKIENYLINKSKKDTDFPETCYLRGDESVPIVQRGLNRRLNVRKFINELEKLSPLAVYNITYKTKKIYTDFYSAISDVPEEYINTGQIVTFYGIVDEISDEIFEKDYECYDVKLNYKHHEKHEDKELHEKHDHKFFDFGWKVYQFNGQPEEWLDRKKWKQFVLRNEDHIDYIPDDEDLEGFNVGDKNFIRFKDVEPGEYQSKGRVWLRKNIVPDEHSIVENEDGSCDCKYVNLLNQAMLDKENTIYMVQYDYTLDNNVINIPKGSVLYMCGGSINDGIIVKSTDSSIVAYNAYIIGENGQPEVNTQNLVGSRIVINN